MSNENRLQPALAVGTILHIPRTITGGWIPRWDEKRTTESISVACTNFVVLGHECNHDESLGADRFPVIVLLAGDLVCALGEAWVMHLIEKGKITILYQGTES